MLRVHSYPPTTSCAAPISTTYALCVSATSTGQGRLATITALSTQASSYQGRAGRHETKFEQTTTTRCDTGSGAESHCKTKKRVTSDTNHSLDTLLLPPLPPTTKGTPSLKYLKSNLDVRHPTKPRNKKFEPRSPPPPPFATQAASKPSQTVSLMCATAAGPSSG